MPSLIYLVRHGAIDSPLPRRFIGQSDPPLSADGILQARRLAGQLQALPFVRVYSSPLQRARHTAAIISGRSSAEIESIDALAEISLGAWEGLTVTEVKNRFPGQYQQRGKDLEFFHPPGGESFSQLADRCYPALLSLTRNQSAPLLIVAHAGVNRVLLCRLQKLPLARLFTIPQDYCGCNVLTHTAAELQVASINLRLDLC